MSGLYLIETPQMTTYSARITEFQGLLRYALRVIARRWGSGIRASRIAFAGIQGLHFRSLSLSKYGALTQR